MKIEFNYEFSKENNRWESALILTKDDLKQKYSGTYYPSYLELSDILHGFKRQIEAINTEISNETD